ncbi:glycine oxidase ThiO [Halopseudomonas salegens]|uniref:Glycine oxidase n=1 Tax=Halopseudomonas salegens TaxID=1434072 RepID=A0A1H2EFG1_9GAMM|nr:glycine oxidase ThiO [Halopseudomonas salegens]SDT93876.1 glycine oxidase [Halopseudomonas salegens]
MQSCIVIGGGIIGGLTALNLLQQGVSVTLLERQEFGRESSWAGGGIVSPLYPWRYPAAISALAYWSQGFYPQLAQELFAATGLDPEVSSTGLLWLDHAESEQALAWAQAQQQPLDQLSATQVYQRVPQLAPGFTQALWQADLGNVRNPRLLAALKARLLQFADFSLHEHTPVLGLQQANGRVCGVQSAEGEILADAVVLAAGAWSGDLLAQAGWQLPVQPVKGQMLLYKAAPGWLSTMVLYQGRYAIPRRDGHILVGSTLEYAGYDKTTTAEAAISLEASAARLLPDLAEQRPVMQWAGLRPGSTDGIPAIGAVDQLPGLWLNTGHFRNGLVLAPAACRLLVDLMLQQPPIIAPEPYAAARQLQPL